MPAPPPHLGMLVQDGWNPLLMPAPPPHLGVHVQNGWNPLLMPAPPPHLGMLMQNGSNPLLVSACNGQLDVVKALLSGGANKQAAMPVSGTPAAGMCVLAFVVERGVCGWVRGGGGGREGGEGGGGRARVCVCVLRG